MITRPAWNQSFRIDVVDEATILLLNERECMVLEGRAFPALVPLLDGRRTVDEIEEALSDRLMPPEISVALEVGESRGAVVEGPTGNARERGFWNYLGTDEKDVREAVEGTAVAISRVGDVSNVSMVSDALAKVGLGTEEEGGLRLALTDDYLRPELAEINADAVNRGRPWLLAKPDGIILWVGPLFVPGITGCWECLRQRLKMNRLIESYLQYRYQQKEPLPLPEVGLESAEATASNWIATEVQRAMAIGSKSPLTGYVATWDFATLAFQWHRLARRPQCGVCGDATHQSMRAEPIRLQHRSLHSVNEAGSRVIPPERIISRFETEISPITGVVRTLEPFGDEDGSGLTHSYVAGHNFAIAHMDLKFVLNSLRGRSGGKGATRDQAKASAICEAIERYSGCYWGDEPSYRARYKDLGAGGVHPYQLMHFSSEQYRWRDEWNRAHASNFHRVPEPFDEEASIDWAPCWSLTHERFHYVPSAYVYFGHPDLRRHGFCTTDSNGNSAGSTLEEAIHQGFLELVERDAVSIFWYNRLRRPGVDLSSFNEGYVNQLVDYFHRIRRDLWALDLTHDFGIPVIAAVSPRTDGNTDDIIVGFGAHPDPRVALLRSLTEVNQFLPSVTMRNQDGETIYRFHETEAIDWWKTAKVAEHRYLLPHEKWPYRRAEDLPKRASGDLKTDIEHLVQVAWDNGMETLVIDQTRPDIGLSVVKVMVPGLRHMWKRFGPGRLYDVPVKMGWLEKPLSEAELNPVGIFF